MLSFITVDMASVVDHSPQQGSLISDLIAKRELNPRRAAALVRARKKIAEHIKDDPISSLAQLRLSKGLSQTMLAEAMGVKQPYIARVERGEDDVKMSTVMNLAKALGEQASVIFRLLESSREAREIR
jgi:DNA-binding XRE family transcriptional regulator